MRSILRHLACAWLACQIAASAAAPLGLCCAPTPVADDVPQCCKNVKAGQECPMHHRREGKPACRMCGSSDSSSTALLSLASGIGLVPPNVQYAVALEPLTIVVPSFAMSIGRADRPDAPPPRA